jgi:hypothetical protein
MTYRSDLDALSARADALEAEVATRTRERDAVRQMLDEARATRPALPTLSRWISLFDLVLLVLLGALIAGGAWLVAHDWPLDMIR